MTEKNKGLRIVLGADANGRTHKDAIKKELEKNPYVASVTDVGVGAGEETDYPFVATEAAERVARAEADRAILVCGTGLGVAIAANKVPGIRAVTAHDEYSVERSILSNNAQVLCMGQQIIDEQTATAFARAWVGLSFDEQSASGRKVEAISSYESQCAAGSVPETNGRFSGRTAVVTGAVAGIGRAVAERLAAEGARVAVVDMSQNAAQAASELPGTGHLGVVADVTESGGAERVAREVAESFGKIDILVNNAGITKLDKAVDVPDEDWDKILDVNLTGSFRMARAMAPFMIDRGYGRIVNLASQAAFIALDQHVSYTASKAGVLGMTKVMAREWARDGVTVNAVSPTVVETELGRNAWKGEVGAKMREAIPVGRFAQPEEIAGLVAYLASEESAMITGENVVIDGGFTIV